MKKMQIAGCVLAMLIMAGCGGKPRIAPMQDPMRQVILGPGDVVSITFTYTPEHDVSQTIRPDGNIVLELIGEVTAAGKTPQVLHDELVGLYERHLKNYDIVVQVESMYSRRVYVGGEVGAPGVVDFPGQLTALGAIMQAGGFKMETASMSRVTIARQKGDTRVLYTIDLKETLSDSEVPVFYLEPYDVVFVPMTKISKFNQFVNQYIDQLFPDIVLATIPYLIYNELRD